MLKNIFLLILLFQIYGCASSSYIYGTKGVDEGDGDSATVIQQMIIGKPSKFLDASDYIWPGSWLGKIVLWNRNIDSHTISESTLEAMAAYLEKNDLNDVQILVNVYKPGLQWKRLFKNKEVGAGWRYTLGIVSSAIYTVLPGRFFGGDHYNPFTNTISIYSDDYAIALHEAAHAKDFNSRKLKGTNAAIYLLPGAALYYEAVASSDAVSYLEYECRYNQEKHAYRTLHPAYGTYMGGVFMKQSGFSFLAAIPGHITGAIAAARVRDRADQASACLAGH